LPEFFKEMGFKVGAEIGVENGIFSEALCRAGLKLYAIDSWDTAPVRENWKRRFAKEYEIAKTKLAPYDCIIIKKSSMEALEDFEDGSLDFVYIDANHSFKFVAEDICGWIKKVKPGGVISGHDYFAVRTNPKNVYAWHVKYVVDAYTEAFEVEDWYILGRKRAVEGERRDKWRSWMWIKE